MALILNWLINTIAVIITAYLLPGVILAGFGTALVVAIVLGLINAFIRPIFLILTLPINILTLGFFTFVINAVMILLVSALVPGFFISNFWWALLFSIILTIISYFMHSWADRKID